MKKIKIEILKSCENDKHSFKINDMYGTQCDKCLALINWADVTDYYKKVYNNDWKSQLDELKSVRSLVKKGVTKSIQLVGGLYRTGKNESKIRYFFRFKPKQYS